MTTGKKNHPRVDRIEGIEPSTLAFLHVLNARGERLVHGTPVEKARAGWQALQAVDTPKPAVDVDDRVLPVGPREETPIRIVRPKGTRDPLPAIIYCHGGGWMLGDRHSYDRLVRDIAWGSNAAVVFVDYTRTPEARYPAAIEEVYAVLWWLSENAKTVNIDANRIAIAGDGAGGNMAAVVTLLAKERKGPGIGIQVLISPVTDAAFDTPSYDLYREGYLFTREQMKWFWSFYLPDLPARTNPTASPLQAEPEDLRGLPQALIITSEHDVLRDEGEAYARKLMSSGVSVTATRYLGTIQSFVILNALADTLTSRTALAEMNDALRIALEQEKIAKAA